MIKKIILGTVQFGLDYGINNTKGKPTFEEIFEILKYATSQGIEILDTADAYGNATEILGSFNIKYPGSFAINTKFKVNHKNLGQQLSNTLKVLHLDKVNTYFYHSFSDFKNYPELLLSLITLKQNNEIRKIGVSVYDNDEFRTIINTAEIDVIQFPFNLLDNYNQRGELMKLAKEKGKELQVRSIFLQGLLFKSPNDLPSILAPLKPYLQNINDLSKENHMTIEQMALSYALGQSEIDNVIIGIDNQKQLEINISAAENIITEEVNDAINKIHVKEVELLHPKNW